MGFTGFSLREKTPATEKFWEQNDIHQERGNQTVLQESVLKTDMQVTTNAGN